LGLAFLLLAASLGLAATMARSSEAKTTEQSVAEGLTCQCGCGLTVANCNHPNCNFSVPMRAQISTMIAQGMNRAQIIGFFRAKYGEKILSAPTTQGFNLLAWTVPPFVLLLGLAIVVFTVTRWRGAAAVPAAEVSAAGTASSHTHDPELRRRLERELKERF
jgi:cytochrome c-type biogenesis protein CcmH